jgi:hypothetical protein
MSSIRQFSETPYTGLPLAEVISALVALKSVEEFENLPIIAVAPRDSGMLLVKTGEVRGPLAGGGRTILLRRLAAGWVVEESGIWAS